MGVETRSSNTILSMLSVLSVLLPMLEIPLKKTTSVDLCPALRSDIARKYSERKAQDLEGDISTLNERRSTLKKLNKEPSFMARLSLLSFYFRTLCLIETLFSSAKDQINKLSFTWFDAFKENKKASQQNIHLEKAAVLFNLGAVHSQIGRSKVRSTNQNRWEAAVAFCRAAGAFNCLIKSAAVDAAMGCSTTLDVSVECAEMLKKLMLAQAQECWFEFAVGREKSPAACAMISRQVALDYDEALAALNAAPLKEHVPDWKSYMQLKADLFNAIACYGNALKLHEEESVAEEIVMLTSGISALSEAKKLTNKKQIVKAIEELEENMKSSLRKAKSDIGYPRSLPSPDSLPFLPSRSMIKQPIWIHEVLIASNERPFASLVYLSNTKAYAEQVNGVIRTHKMLHEHVSRMLKMGPSNFILALEGHLTLPIKEGVEAVQNGGAIAGLEAKLQQLGDLRRLTQEHVVQTEKHLRTKPQSSTQSKKLQDWFNGINDDVKRREENEAKIKSLVESHSAIMSILDHRPIESALPIFSLDANEGAIVGALKESLEKLDTLGAQGERLQQELEHIHRKLSASTGSPEDLFKEEISKYVHTCKEINQNIVARKELLLQIQAQNDQWSSFPNLEKCKASCQKFYEKIRVAIDKYQEIKEYIIWEKNFYVTLQKTVKNVKQQRGEFQGPEMIQSDVPGQATSALVEGGNLEGAIEGILEMGGKWDRDTVVRALVLAHNNPNGAVEYLYSGIPEQAKVPPAARVPPGAQAAHLPGQPARPAQPATGQLPSAMPQPQAVTIMPEEYEVMERLEAMGFDRANVKEVYFAVNKDGERAANYLLDHMNPRTDLRK